ASANRGIAILSLHDALPIFVEPRGRVVRVEQLLLAPPPLAGTLLEQPEGVPVPVVQVAETGFLKRGGDADRRRPCGKPSLDGHRSEEHTSELQSRENLVCRL